MSWRAIERATSKRFGSTSVAFIEAEASSNTTTVPLATVGMLRNGGARAITSAASKSSCRSNSRLRLSRCHGALASRSRRSNCQSIVDEIPTSLRRSLSMYRMRIGTARRPRRRARGARKDMGVIDAGRRGTGKRGSRGEGMTWRSDRSLDQPAPAQVVQHQLIPGGVGRDRDVVRAALEAIGLDLVLPRGHALAIARAQAAVERHVLRVAGFRINQAQVAREGRVNLVWREQVQETHFIAAPLQLRETVAITGGREQVGEDKGQAGPPGAERIGAERGVELGHAAGLQVFQEAQKAEGVPASPRRAILPAIPLTPAACAAERGEHRHHQPVAGGERDVAERGGEALGVAEFVLLVSAIVHRARG